MTLIGESEAIQAVREQVKRLLQQLADKRRPPVVLLEGETGTGKGLVARHLHRDGPRARGPFIDVNCAAIPETLLEAELFGFERGAFTDARQAKPGLFQAAHGGTLFLDEVGLLPAGLQAKLLKVLEDRAVRRLGSIHTMPVDIWIIAASNEDLGAAVRAGRVRQDFYHRIASLVVRLPPLRERGGDIRLLAEHFLAQASTEYGLPPKHLALDAVAALQTYPWPGNVRELSNIIERAVVLGDGPELPAHMLGLPVLAGSAPTSLASPAGPALREAVDRFEREHLLGALAETNWNISFAADRLGIPRNTLRYRMSRYGLQPPAAPSRRRKLGETEPSASAPVPTAVVEETSLGALRKECRQIVWLQAVLQESLGSAHVRPSRARGLLMDKAESFGGYVQDSGRDRILVVFGLEPNEDASRRATNAGLAMFRAAARFEPPADVRLTVIVHAMSAVVEERNESRQLATESRLAGQAELATLSSQVTASGVLVTASMAPLLERWFQLDMVANHERGPGAPTYRVLGPRPGGFAAGVARRVSPFVGREKELMWLQQLFGQLAEGRGLVVGLVGEPGGGKSRLLHEFRQRLVTQPVTYLEGRCLSHGSGVPYLPVLDLLRRAWDLDESDAPDALAAAIRRRLSGALEEQAIYFLRLFGVTTGTEALAVLSAEAIKRRTFEAIRQVIFGLDGPVVLAVEDLHWIDKTSEEFFTSLVDSTPGTPLLFASTYRPGYRSPWIDRSYVSQLALAPLSVADSRTVVRAILPEEEIPDTVAQAIVARAEGNPFFLEELALPVAQGGPHGNLASVPQSIGDVLMARMQRLPDQLQRVLETAATLGREGPVRLLDGMLQSPADLPDQLQELVRLEFLYDQMGGTGRRFSFRHALIQEVTYSRLAQPARSRLHAAAGRALEALYADRLEEVLDRLAYHYSRTDESRTAVTYLTRFAEKATASYSLTEAVAALEDALIHAERLASDQGREACVLRIVAQLAECLIFLGRLTEARDVLLRHTDRVDRLSDPLLVGPHYFLLAGAYDHLGEPKAALAAAHRSIAEATRAGDAATVGKAHVLLAHANLWAGQFKTGVENSRRAARGLAGHGEVLWSGMAHWIRAWHHILLGEFALAVEASEEVRAVGEASGIRRLESYGICIAGWVAFLHGDVAAGIEACERAATLAPDPLAEAVVLSILGEAYAEAGEFQQGEQRLTKAVGLVRQFHMPQMECWTLCRLSHIHIAEGRIEVARELASRMLLLAGQATFPFGQGLTQRVLGRVAAATNSLDIAQMTLTRALDIFSELRARYEVARTRVDLAGLAHLSNDHSGSLSQLRKAYALYSELGARGQCERVVQLGRRLGAPLVEQ